MGAAQLEHIFMPLIRSVQQVTRGLAAPLMRARLEGVAVGEVLHLRDLLRRDADTLLTRKSRHSAGFS